MKQSRLFSYLFCFLAMSFVNSLAAQKAISVESFSEIVLTGRMNVELKIADKEEVIIETKGIEVEDVSVYVKGGVLKINALNAFKNKNIEINIIVYHKDLYEISASAGAVVTKGETLNGDKLDLDVSSGAKISIDVNVKSLKAFCSSGANLLLSGKVESGQLTALTGGMIDGKKLEAERAYVVSSTGISELDIRSNTGGNVTYYGTPVKKTIKKAMAGKVVNEY
ncbi:MAG: hypothetical protein RJA90_1105 [Bacteroidota bacterium]